ncbi:GNAT family N-acetyltransferase [Candidatus Planktophila lacus]|uniref:Acetyltransferase n=1 Tax=Candidatus Planktophila lacus TaxID=1884913 RepID=A0AAC9YQI7_9ACTN|nr:GNAT family N-acetyltransferase [Candidatus Planktophila lacus]ASY10290.1 acetyltransferase [Candidatus Planktophila lacus]
MNLKEPVISTARLELHHISADRLIDLFEKRDDTFALVGETFTNPLRNLIDFQGPLAWRVPQVKADPATNKWFVRWIVLKENREVIGSTSFHGTPDAQGMMEIGLGIETQYQNQGYAKEALLGMWRWVLTFPEVKTLRYTVSPQNLPSIAVIKYFGFDFKGQQIDEEDGPEDIYEMDRETFLKKWGAN